jgi:hypothetical protein
MAAVLEATGKRAEARTLLVEWLELHPESGNARLELARLSSADPAKELAQNNK